jgi:hypothetical protein
MKCEKCQKEHDGSFGSGRFCSRSCANSKERPFEVKRKISITLKNKPGVRSTYKERSKKYKDKKRAMIISKLGDKCVICKKDRTLILHNKLGIRHTGLMAMRLSDLKDALVYNHYVQVCSRCHGCIHWCMKYLNMDWEKNKAM